MAQDRKALRLVDANLNRLKEGLRVCEDVLRFIYDDRRLTLAFKRLRHECSKTVLQFPMPYRRLVMARNVNGDVGKDSSILDVKRPNWEHVVVSNVKRAEESLRVLEECSKILAPRLPGKFQQMRFRLYELEKKLLTKL